MGKNIDILQCKTQGHCHDGLHGAALTSLHLFTPVDVCLPPILQCCGSLCVCDGHAGHNNLEVVHLKQSKVTGVEGMAFEELLKSDRPVSMSIGHGLNCRRAQTTVGGTIPLIA